MKKLAVKANPEFLYMVSRFVSKETHRFYLNGVNVQKHPSGGIIMVATDGYRLAAMHDKNGFITDAESAIINVDGHLASSLKNKKAKEFHQRGEVSHVMQYSDMKDIDNIGIGHLHMSHNKPIEGTFPNWQRTVPKTFNKVGHMCFNHKYVQSFVSLLGKGQVGVTTFYADEYSPTVFRCEKYPDFLGMLMPMRSGYAAEQRFPDWYKDLS